MEIPALNKLDSLISIARIEMYKPIQVAEVLHRARQEGSSIDGTDVETYRVASRRWRDEVTLRLYGKASTSSSRYQDDLWNEHQVPPWAVADLMRLNSPGGSIEERIYAAVADRWSSFRQLNELVAGSPTSALLRELIEKSTQVFASSADRVTEILVVGLLNAELRLMKPSRHLVFGVQLNPTGPLSPLLQAALVQDLVFDRIGKTNAADAGLDIWSNFGVSVSVKNRVLDARLMAQVLEETPVGDLIVACREVDSSVSRLVAKLDRNVSVITLGSLVDRASVTLKDVESSSAFKQSIQRDFEREFPQVTAFPAFLSERGYATVNF